MSEPPHPEGPETDEQDDEMMRAFASVWVKVEVGEGEEAVPDDKLPRSQKEVVSQQPQELTYNLEDESDYDEEEGFLEEEEAWSEDQNIDNNKSEDTIPSLNTDALSSDSEDEWKQAYRLNKDAMISFETEEMEDTTRPKRKCTKLERIKCDQCDYTTSYKSSLICHMKTHEGAQYNCDLCSYTTVYQGAINRHKAIKHKIQVNEKYAKKILQCDQCDYTTAIKCNLKSHKRKHELEKEFKCPHCPFETAYKHNLQKHSRVHKETMTYKCDKCVFETKFEGHITRHLAQIHNEITEKAKNMCEYCNFATKERWRLKIHKQRSKSVNVIKCEFCDFETYYLCGRRQHRKTHYSEAEKLIDKIESQELDEMSLMILSKQITPKKSTDNVNDNFNDSANSSAMEADLTAPLPAQTSYYDPSSYIVDHNLLEWKSIRVLNSADSEKPYQCFNCSYTAKFKASVQRHYQRHHTSDERKPYRCLQCNFRTKTKDQIALHSKRSVSETPLYCTSCSFSTYYKCVHSSHLKIHYLYKCEICTFSCRNKCDLTKHIAVNHLGTGFKCQYCDYKAMRRDTIVCHEAVHTGVKPYKCQLCDYSSVRLNLLSRHMIRVHRNTDRKTIISQSKIESLRVPLSNEELLNASLINECNTDNVTVDNNMPITDADLHFTES